MNIFEKTARTTLHHLRVVKRQIKKRNQPYIFCIDSPSSEAQEKRTVMFEGWLIPLRGLSVQGLRVRHKEHEYEIEYGKERKDIAQIYKDNPSAMYSGYAGEIPVIDGVWTVQADFGKGYESISRFKTTYAPEKSYKDYFTPNLSELMAEHKNLLDARKAYEYEPKDNRGAYERGHGDPKLMSFYLPQFHPIDQNDRVWGKGFTEWTNVTAAESRFVGHQQPFLPGDLGFYDLRLEQKMKEQIDLAKEYGIYGFCFYYYWFSGEKIMDTPINNFLKNKDWDFNFTICWANENWTKRWDGRESDVIIAQKYNDTDPLDFIKDVEHILTDPRYITKDGKPVLIVYRASELKEPEKYAKIWRAYFLDNYQTELHLVTVMGFDDSDPRKYGFDAAIEFAPQTLFFKNHTFKDSRYPFVSIGHKLLDSNFSGQVADYRQIATNIKQYDVYDFPVYRSVTPSWDNDARRKGSGFVLANTSSSLYARWLDNALENRQSDDDLLFINAWNEWAEGAVLEPTRHNGYAILNRTRETLSRHSKKNDSKYSAYQIEPTGSKTAVIVHLYYPDRWPQIKEYLRKIPFKDVDVYITINKKDSDQIEILESSMERVKVFTVPNRGRDVLPFLYVVERLRHCNYERVLKLHSKKSLHRSDGEEWFGDVLSKLVPTDDKAIAELKETLDKKGTSMVGPSGHAVSLFRHIGSNKNSLHNLLDIAGRSDISAMVDESMKDISFFGGTMFWARFDYLLDIANLYLNPEDFQPEKGQIDGTTAHAVERLFGVMAWLNARPMYEISNLGVKRVGKVAAKKYRYAK